MKKTLIDKKIHWTMYKPCDAKFLIMASEGGKIVDINHFEIVGNRNGRQEPPICTTQFLLPLF